MRPTDRPKLSLVPPLADDPEGPRTVYHRAEQHAEAWNQANPVFGHRLDWSKFCPYCKEEGGDEWMT